jgi:DNA-binding HxlR family transcriptional regulator
MSARCSSRRYLATLTSKWSILIVNALGHGPLRNGELLRAVEGISQKMLTQSLQELTALNIIQRDDKKTIPPHVEYRLTDLGHGHVHLSGVNRGGQAVYRLRPRAM